MECSTVARFCANSDVQCKDGEVFRTNVPGDHDPDALILVNTVFEIPCSVRSIRARSLQSFFMSHREPNPNLHKADLEARCVHGELSALELTHCWGVVSLRFHTRREASSTIITTSRS